MSYSKRVMRRTNSGSICDDSTRIWEDPPPPYSFEDPMTSASSCMSSGSDGEVFSFPHSRRRHAESESKDRRIRSNRSVSTDLSKHRHRASSGQEGGVSDSTFRVPELTSHDAQKIHQSYCKKKKLSALVKRNRRVEHVENHFCHHYCLKSYIEERRRTKESRPYKPGEKLPKIEKSRDYDTWDLKCPRTDGSRTVVPNTTQKVTCYKCSGVGYENCSCCCGAGKTSCYHCHGLGRIPVSVSHTERPKDGEPPTIQTHHRHDTCHRCHGDGRESCSSCHGSGRRECTKCEGQKHLVQWEEVVVNLRSEVSNQFASVPQGFQERKLVEKEAKGYQYFLAKGRTVDSVSDNDCIDPKIQRASKALIQKHSTLRGLIYKQEHCVSLVPVCLAHIHRSDPIWIIGKQRIPTSCRQHNEGCCIM